MHTATTTIIHAPLDAVFESTSDLANWPNVLPHYRYVRFLEQSPAGAIVKMACFRSGIPISWVSEFRIDRENRRLEFRHLRAFTKGMDVVWSHEQLPGNGGVRVSIVHDLKFRVPALARLADAIIGGFFIEHVATRTLRQFKLHLEGANG